MAGRRKLDIGHFISGSLDGGAVSLPPFPITNPAALFGMASLRSTGGPSPRERASTVRRDCVIKIGDVV
jgi:hypothetical protein